MERPGVRRPPAMSDVAAVAGVSHQTVSRVLNGATNVRPETRQRVLAAIGELGYRRNSAARALVTRRTGMVGVVAPASSLYGPTSALVSLEHAARRRALVFSVAMLEHVDADAMRATVERLLTQGVEGIVVVAPTVEVLGALADEPPPLPVVIVSSGAGGAAGFHWASVDQRGGAHLATQHLLARGYREVAHVAGPPDWFDAQSRLRGWSQACEAAGVSVREPIAAGWQAADGEAAGRRLLAEGLPEAVFAANDQLALGLLHAFWSAGVRVPDDVAVVGFDDEVGSRFFIPALTTVRQDFEALGAEAIRMVAEAIDGAAVDDVVVPAELVVRASSGAA